MLLCLALLISGDCLKQPGGEILFDLQKISTPPGKSHYKHFVPRSSLIRLEFDYPETWIVSVPPGWEKSQIGLLAFFDPRYHEIPTKVPNVTHGNPNDIASVSFFSEPVTEKDTFTSSVEGYSAGCRNDAWTHKIAEYQGAIDHRIAAIIECQIQPNELYSTIMFNKTYIFEANNTIYSIIFTIAENRRGDEFESGFEKLIKSIKVVE